jgi:hypothetical protein
VLQLQRAVESFEEPLAAAEDDRRGDDRQLVHEALVEEAEDSASKGIAQPLECGHDVVLDEPEAADQPIDVAVAASFEADDRLLEAGVHTQQLRDVRLGRCRGAHAAGLTSVALSWTASRRSATVSL